MFLFKLVDNVIWPVLSDKEESQCTLDSSIALDNQWIYSHDECMVLIWKSYLKSQMDLLSIEHDVKFFNGYGMIGCRVELFEIAMKSTNKFIQIFWSVLD